MSQTAYLQALYQDAQRSRAERLKRRNRLLTEQPYVQTKSKAMPTHKKQSLIDAADAARRRMPANDVKIIY